MAYALEHALRILHSLEMFLAAIDGVYQFANLVHMVINLQEVVDSAQERVLHHGLLKTIIWEDALLNAILQHMDIIMFATLHKIAPQAMSETLQLIYALIPAQLVKEHSKIL